MTESQLERRLRTWFDAEVGHVDAPASLATAVEAVPGASVDRGAGLPALGDRPVRFLLAAAAAIAVVGVVGVVFGPQLGGLGGPPAASGSASPSGTPRPAATEGLPVGSQALPPGPYALRWPGGPVGSRLTFVIPDGVGVSSDGSTIHIKDDGSPWGPMDAGMPEIAVHDVSGIVDTVCAYSSPERHLVDVGPSGADLTTALASQQGWPEGMGPVDASIAGYPAEKFAFSLKFDGGCRDPAEGVMLWQNADGTRFVSLRGRRGTVTVWIVDVDGRRLVLTTTDHLDVSSPAARARRDVILASLRIDLPSAATGTPDGAIALPPSGEIPPGRYYIPWGNLKPYLTIPAGWSSTNDGQAISKYPGSYRPTVQLAVHSVTLFVATDVCTSKRTLVETTDAEEFTRAIVEQVGVQRSGPTDVLVGRFPAKKFVLILPPGMSWARRWPGPGLP